MDGGPIGRLTEKQRACLRLVHQHYTSKQIARELGIGVDAVDQRIKSAMKTLGVTRRGEAARILLQGEDPEFVGVVEQPREAKPESGQSRANLWKWLRRALPATRRSRFILLSSMIALILGFIDFPLPAEDWYRSLLTDYGSRKASGDIVIIGLDDRSYQRYGYPPWSRYVHARLTRNLGLLGARDIVFTNLLNRKRNPGEDRALAASFRAVDNKLILLVWERGSSLDPADEVVPLPQFSPTARLAHGNIGVMPWNVTERMLYNLKIGGRVYPSISSMLAAWPGEFWERSFPIDYAIDPATIPEISALDVINGDVSAEKIFGKSVVIADVSLRYPDEVSYAPHYGKLPLVDFVVLGAETLLAGPAFQIPWIITMIPALIIAVMLASKRSRVRSVIVSIGGIAFYLALPPLLHPHKVYTDIGGPIILLSLIGFGLSRAEICRNISHRAAGATPLRRERLV